MCKVSQTKENSCGLLSPRKGKNQGGCDLKTTEQEKGAGLGVGRQSNHSQIELKN